MFMKQLWQKERNLLIANFLLSFHHLEMSRNLNSDGRLVYGYVLDKYLEETIKFLMEYHPMI